LNNLEVSTRETLYLNATGGRRQRAYRSGRRSRGDRIRCLKTERNIAGAALDRIASQIASSTAITPEGIEAFAALVREKIDSADV
jgi:hypothetical protein